MADKTYECSICSEECFGDFCARCIEVMPQCRGCEDAFPNWELENGLCKACRRPEEGAEAADDVGLPVSAENTRRFG